MRHVDLELQPLYELPGSQGLQRPQTPGDANAVDIYGLRRYLRRDWQGVTVNSNPNGPLYQNLGSNFIKIDEDAQAIQIGSQSEAYAVRVYHSGSSEYILVTSDAPFVGLVKSPFYVTPTINSPIAHTVEIVTYKRPPRQLLTQRAPLLYAASINSGTAFYAPVFGRRNIRFKIFSGTVNTNIQYVINEQLDDGYIQPTPSYGFSTTLAQVVIAQETFNATGTQKYLIRDTVNSPNMFPSQRYDVIGLQPTNANVTAYIQAFD